MTQRILIVGGGIGGLSLAGLLERRVPACEITLVERAQAWAPVGAGITLSGNALRQLDGLGVVARVVQEGAALEGMRIADGGGRSLSETTIEHAPVGRDEFTRMVVAIHRWRLHDILRDAVRAARLRLGVEPLGFRTVESGVEVEMSDGESSSYDLVVGADGLRSRVREEVADSSGGKERFRYGGYTCWRSVVEMSGSPLGASRTAWELWGRGKRFGVVPIGHGQVYFYACVNAPQGDPAMASVDRTRFVQMFSDFRGPVPEVLSALNAQSPLHHDDLGDVRLSRWTRGRFVLLGDAAHATTPNLGQEAGLAIEDSAALAEELARWAKVEQGLEARLHTYEARRRERVDRLQRLARRVGSMAQWQSRAGAWIRDRLVAATPNSAAATQVARIVDETT